MLPNNSLSFITNNVKGMQSSKKRLKLMQYFKDRIGSTSVLCLQETHSDGKVKQKWIVEFLWRLNCLLWNRNVYR